MANLQFSLDELGNRIVPFPKGKGFCPVCEGAMIAKCGDIYRWHWQHVRDRNCDSWKEHETRWHREWKEKFPPECREVIIQHDGEKHIADVLTKSGVVIEFQNSSIAAGTILIREAFYDDMIWVINAIPFRDNFSIKSKVNQLLFKLDRLHTDERELDYSWDSGLERFDKKLKALKLERDEFSKEVKRARWRLDELERSLPELEALSQTTLNSWSTHKYVDYRVFGMSQIANSLKTGHNHRYSMLQNLKSDLDEVCQRIRDIEAREIYLYQGINYALVLFKELKPEHIHRCIVISKLDKDSMFPTVLKFRSEADFLSYQYKTANYLFAINPEETITRFRKDAERLENEHSEMLSEIPDYLELLNSGFKEFVDRELSEAEGKFYNAQEREMEVQSRIYTVEIEREAYKDDLAEQHEKDSRAEKLRYEAERTRIMKTYKGKYTFIWKRERKSWADTSCPVYFDIGEDYLFERTGDDSLVKVPNSEFLKRHL